MKMEGGRNDEIFEGGRNENDNRAYWDLHEAAAKGDWGKAEEIFKGNPQFVGDEHSDLRNTALQAAVLAGHSDFVEKLLRSSYMKKEDLERNIGGGNTAFSHAAMLGNIEVVLMMLEKNKDLVNIRYEGAKLPVQMAASVRQEKIVKCLYNPKKDKDHLNDEDRILLLLTLIDNDIYDVAQSMVEEFPSLAVSRENKTDGNGETALHALARKPLMTLNQLSNKQGILKRFCYRFIRSIMVEKKKMDPKARKLLEVLWEKIVNQLDYNQISNLIGTRSRLISDAAKEGNIEFISILISKQPNVIYGYDENGYTLFHTAVEYRQDKIFELIYERDSIKNVICALKAGKEKNTILHLAAKLPPDQNRLNVVSGAALRMQRELWWFKKVRKLLPPSYAGYKNGQGKTAQTLFTESHKDLMKEGEKWMKTTANSCMIVATLIATIVFAAAIAVPGGVKDDTGAPHFLRKASFKWFVIFDIISLVSSSCSILSFLSILTARYAEEDYLRSLPIKLLLGLVTLFISTIAMMVVFCTTLFIIFDEGTKVLAFLAVALAFIPVTTFIWQQTSLFRDVVRSLSYNISPCKAK
ncbi:hypothetical protein EZV62_027528 [Acer yangbiense]|uniref:PGG domain-containing protein n=1 Tax=Acer yangbiense TaxID=1000413 RepID=A0A5C7GTW2_9ROSI|nr:hypothetical protein EZV62_027528 [Acer yangbiense]